MIDRLPQTPIDTPGERARGAFAHPQDVVAAPNLSTAEKRRILEEWSEESASDENAREHGIAGTLNEIKRALAEL